MTLTQYLFETGPDGASATNGTSGSTASSVTSGGSTTFSTTKAAHGAFGLRIVNVAAGQAFRRYPFAAPTTTFRFSGVVTLPAAAPAAGNMPIGSFPNTAGSGRLRFYLNAAGDLGIFDAANVSTEVIAAANLTMGQKYRITVSATGGSTTASAVTIKVYSGTTAWTTQVGATFTKTNLNMGTDNVVGFDAGITSNFATSMEVGWDDLQLDDTAGVELADIVVVTPPTSPVFRWSGSAYVPLNAHRWDGAAYDALITA